MLLGIFSKAMTRRILISIICCVFLLGFPALGMTDLIAHWTFDGNANDSAGTNDGTLLGSASFSSAGKVGQALSLNKSSGDLVSMGDVLGLAGMSYTISVWVQTTTNEQSSFVLTKHYATNISGYLLGINANGGYGAANKAWFYNGANPVNDLISTTDVNDGQWHHLVVTRTLGGSMFIYVDGSPAEYTRTDTGLSNPPSGTPLLFGGYLNSDGITLMPTYTGLIDEVRFYNYALSDNEVQYLFNNPGQVVPLPGAVWLLGSGLIGLWGLRRKMRP